VDSFCSRSRRQIPVGRVSSLRYRIRSGSRPVRGARVLVRGARVKAAARTSRKGIVNLCVRPKRAGVIRLRAPEALSCTVRVGAARQRVGGEGLTG
jgi:hypothetical protein